MKTIAKGKDSRIFEEMGRRNALEEDLGKCRENFWLASDREKS